MCTTNKKLDPGRVLTPSQPSLLCIIGIGSEERGDDALGLLCARALRQRAWPHIRILESSGEGTALLEAWEGSSHVIVIDAVATGALPGTVYSWNLRASLPPRLVVPISSHAFGLPEALELARALQCLPETLLLYAIEGACFGPGLQLSPAVARTMPVLLQSLERKLQELLRYGL